MTELYTVGHSTHSTEDFLAMLEHYAINCIVDVRSIAFSRYNPQYNQPVLRDALKAEGIVYMHFEEEFGAKHTHPSMLDEDGKVDFDKVRATAAFQRGVQRLRNGLDKGYRIALMCSEAYPFGCHRYTMISYGLVKAGFDVKHILGDGTCINTTDLEARLLETYHAQLPSEAQYGLFDAAIPSHEERLALAYRLHSKTVAYDAGKNAEAHKNPT